MSGHFNKITVVKKTKIDRKCQWCGDEIKAGSKADKVVIKDYEGFHSFYVCSPICNKWK